MDLSPPGRPLRSREDPPRCSVSEEPLILSFSSQPNSQTSGVLSFWLDVVAVSPSGRRGAVLVQVPVCPPCGSAPHLEVVSSPVSSCLVAGGSFISCSRSRSCRSGGLFFSGLLPPGLFFCVLLFVIYSPDVPRCQSVLSVSRFQSLCFSKGCFLQLNWITLLFPVLSSSPGHNRNKDSPVGPELLRKEDVKPPPLGLQTTSC